MGMMLFGVALGAVLAVTSPTQRTPLAISTDSVTAVSAKTTVEVDNAAFNDAVVYAVQGARVVRLGMVNGLTKQTLTIPRTLVGGLGLRFAIHPIGSRQNSVSDEVLVSVGDTIGLYIAPF